MIHYHGGRHSTWQVAVEIWKRRHALVSYADPQQIVIAAEVAQSFSLDNGAFSVWKQGIEVNDYLQNLNSIKKGENPTPAELDKAHQMTAADCDKDTGAADCKAFAKDMLTAAKLSYDVNKKWVLAGCPGTLTSITKKSSD